MLSIMHGKIFEERKMFETDVYIASFVRRNYSINLNPRSQAQGGNALARVRVQLQTISKFIRIMNNKIIYFILQQVIGEAVHTCRYLVL